MKPEDKIKKVHVDIMRHKTWCAVSGLLACGKTTVTKDTKTACTDGWNVQYNPDFVASLTEPELRFVVLHENAGHKAYRHLTVWRDLWKENPRLANIAADHMVNLALHETDAGEGFIKMPKVGIQPDPKYHGMSVKQIYDALKDEDEQDGGEGEGGMDSHDWENAQDQTPEQAQEIDRALRQGEIVRRKRAGQGAGNSEGVFGALLTPKVDWREALREFVQATCQGTDESSWRKVSRRYLADDVYMPSLVGESMHELVIGFDTSGSCFGTDEMTRFVSEITTIVSQVCPAKTHVVYWDCNVQGHQVFEDGQFAVQSLKPRGGGGTNGAVLFDWLREKRINPQAVVQFSDGYVGNWGKSDWPTLWALTSNLRSPYGTTVQI